MDCGADTISAARTTCSPIPSKPARLFYKLHINCSGDNGYQLTIEWGSPDEIIP